MKIIAPLMMITAVSGFCPPPTTRPSLTVVSMGLFDFLQPKEDKPSSSGGMDNDVFGGKGDRITIREDEDNAMWVDDGDKKDKKKGPFGKGK